VKDHIYLTSEAEPVFDAADIMRFGKEEAEPVLDAVDIFPFGKDVFVHMGFTTNNFGFDWLRRHCAARGLRAHQAKSSAWSACPLAWWA
ncbi:hypothetical protein T484DRAFT_1857531, partial [Baffinella frigidus]